MSLSSKVWGCVAVVLACLAAAGARNSHAGVQSTGAPAQVSGAAALNAEHKGENLYLSGHFEPNIGQTGAAVKFLSRGIRYSMYFTERAVLLALPDGEQAGDPQLASASVPGRRKTSIPQEAYRLLRMRLLSDNPPEAVEGEQELESTSNYFIGSDPAKWRTGVPNFGRVRYRNVYPGTDLLFYRNAEAHLEYDFILAPNADYRRIRLLFEGAEQVRINEEGDLELHSGSSMLLVRRPKAHQVISGRKIAVASDFELLEAGEVAFRVGEYDRAHELIIDPTLLFSTYLGAAPGEWAYGLAVGTDGSAYFTGSTTGAFPVEAPYQSTYQGGSADAFVIKLSPSGKKLVYSTYLGGNALDLPAAIQVDSSGAAYIVGTTASNNFPITQDAYQSYRFWDAFVVKLNPAGSGLVYATFFGGYGTDKAFGLALDASGNAYIVGEATVPQGKDEFPLVNAFQGQRKGHSDGFVAKLDAAGKNVLYSTFLGSDNQSWQDDSLYDIALDAAGRAHVIGVNKAKDFPTTDKSSLHGNERDMVVAKLSAGGDQLMFGTYLGGNGWEEPQAITVDHLGNIVVCGSSASNNFPATKGAVQQTIAAPADAVVAKFSPNGALLFATYFGADGGDDAFDVAVDGEGNIYTTGFTGSVTLQVTAKPPALQARAKGNGDAFLTVFSPTGTALLYSTYWGGDGRDTGEDIALGPGKSIYISGQTSSNDFPVKNFVQEKRAGAQGFTDIFISKFGEKYIFLR